MSRSPIKVLFRVDANQSVALGHLKRCLSLGRSFLQAGIPVIVAAKPDRYANRVLAESGVPHAAIKATTGSPTDARQTVALARKAGAVITVVDSYHIGNAMRRRLMAAGQFVVSLTDTGYTNVASHLAFNSNLNADRAHAHGPRATVFHTGIRYLILGPRFWSARPSTARLDQVEDVLITMGGIDHYNLSTKILKILARGPGRFSVTVIIGPYYTNVAEIEKQAAAMDAKVTLARCPPDLFEYMKRCSLAFSAGGQTLYELAVLGRPVIGISLWKNQKGNVQELARKGAIEGIQYSRDARFLKALAARTGDLLSDARARRRLSRAASGIVDGHGARRTRDVILAAFRAHHSSVRPRLG